MKLIYTSIAAALLFAQAPAQALQNKVLLVGIDGVQLERIEAINTPAFDRLMLKKAYTGGIKGTQNQQATKSGPGWATILSGVWANKHKVTSNGSGLADSRFPSVFKQIKTAHPNSKIHSYSTWGPIHSQFFTNDLSAIDHKATGGTDLGNYQKALSALQTGDPDMIFLHLDEPDTVAHSVCFGNAYDQSIQTADSRLGALLDEVEKRQANNENWLVLVTTDHGRTPTSGCGHGNQTKEEKTIFIASNQSLNAEYQQTVPNLPNSEFADLYGSPSQAAITPTILRHMGIEPTLADQFDSIPLNGALGVQKLQMADDKFSWYSQLDKPVNIYKNGSLVDSIGSQTQSWQPPTVDKGLSDYVFNMQNSPVGYRNSNTQLTAAHGWNNDKIYFFRADQQFVRYDKSDDKTDNEYPRDITDNSWPGLDAYKDKITAAFKASIDTVYFFLNDGQYLKYNIVLDKVLDGYPQAINNQSWPGMAPYATKIQAALKWSSDKVQFFLDDGSYIRYDLGNDSVDAGYPASVNNSNWPGLGDFAGKINAAIKWSSNKVYFFLENGQYIRYSISNDATDEGYPATVDNNSWQGLLNP